MGISSESSIKSSTHLGIIKPPGFILIDMDAGNPINNQKLLTEGMIDIHIFDRYNSEDCILFNKTLHAYLIFLNDYSCTEYIHACIIAYSRDWMCSDGRWIDMWLERSSYQSDKIKCSNYYCNEDLSIDDMRIVHAFISDREYNPAGYLIPLCRTCDTPIRGAFILDKTTLSVPVDESDISTIPNIEGNVNDNSIRRVPLIVDITDPTNPKPYIQESRIDINPIISCDINMEVYMKVVSLHTLDPNNVYASNVRRSLSFPYPRMNVKKWRSIARISSQYILCSNIDCTTIGNNTKVRMAYFHLSNMPYNYMGYPIPLCYDCYSGLYEYIRIYQIDSTKFIRKTRRYPESIRYSMLVNSSELILSNKEKGYQIYIDDKAYTYCITEP